MLHAFLRRAAALLFIFTACALAHAAFPDRAVTIIVPYPAGGPTDIVVRLMAPLLQERWKQPVLVVNRGGGAAVIGTDAAVHAKADGHTLLFAADNAMTVMKLYNQDLRFDPMKDLKTITALTSNPYVITVPAELPVRTMQEFIAYARQRPGQMNYSMIPNTNMPLDYAIIQERGNFLMTGISYQGGGPMAQAVLKNEVQFAFASYQQVGQHIAAGKLIPLAVTGSKRIESLPNVPTLREAGIDYSTGSKYLFFAPRQTPDALVQRIAADLAAVARSPEIQARLNQMGFDVVANPPAQAYRELSATTDLYSGVARKLKVKTQ